MEKQSKIKSCIIKYSFISFLIFSGFTAIGMDFSGMLMQDNVLRE